MAKAKDQSVENKKKVDDAKKALVALREVRRDFEPEIDNIITYVTHGRRLITEKGRNKGKRTGQSVYDSTALSALNTSVDGLAGLTISRALRWFSYTLPLKVKFSRASIIRGMSGKRLDEFPEVRVWLDDFEEVMYGAFRKSNLYSVADMVIRDALSIGTVSPLLEEDLENERFVLQVPHFRECYLAENMFGMVDTNYRVYDLSLRALKDKFGEERMLEIHPQFKSKYEKNPFQEMEVLHCVFPRKDYVSGRLDKQGLPVVSRWFLNAGTGVGINIGVPSKLIEESGYPEMPSFSWRWRKNGDETYGRSPIWDAMVEILTAQQEGRTNLIAGHKMADPPMVGLKDLRNKVRKEAGGWTSVGGMDEAPKPLNDGVGVKLPFTVEMQNRLDEKIRGHLQTDFFMLLTRAMLEKVELTATQVFEMSGEKSVVLASRVGPMEDEFMNPLHDRAVAIEARARRLPVPPDIVLDLWDGSYDVEYLGPFSQIQKRLYKNKGIRAGLEALGFAGAIFPEAKFVADPIGTTMALMESAGFPAKYFRNLEQIEELIQGAAQAEQIGQQGPAIAQLLKAIPGLGKQIAEGSPLKALEEGGEDGE